MLPTAIGNGVQTASNRNEYQKQKKKIFLGSKVRPVRKTDNITAVSVPVVQTMWNLQYLTTL
jgi:hypothetical protein